MIYFICGSPILSIRYCKLIRTGMEEAKSRNAVSKPENEVDEYFRDGFDDIVCARTDRNKSFKV